MSSVKGLDAPPGKLNGTILSLKKSTYKLKDICAISRMVGVLVTVITGYLYFLSSICKNGC
ncbi:hypothetical protein J4423_00105 [Candidatus Pacearchaeota archaeon]|nr:hypothetical protein [Candidatus Pacearchaeota archaeon]